MTPDNWIVKIANDNGQRTLHLICATGPSVCTFYRPNRGNSYCRHRHKNEV